MKKDIKAWAIKIKNRMFYQDVDGNPFLYTTKVAAEQVALRIANWESIKAEPVRVKVRVQVAG